MTGRATLVIAGSVGLSALIGAAAWAIRVNSVTARDACIHNLKEIDASIQRVSANARPSPTTKHESK